MSHTLTETISFDPSCVVPDILDTDYPTTVPQGVQALANRTQFLLDNANTLAGRTTDLETQATIVRSRAVFTVGPDTPGGIYKIVKLFDGTPDPDAYAQSSNRIHVPEPGQYLLDLNVFVEQNLGMTQVGVALYIADVISREFITSVPDGATGWRACIRASEYLNITNAGTQLISIRPLSGDTGSIYGGSGPRSPTPTLVLQRLA